MPTKPESAAPHFYLIDRTPVHWKAMAMAVFAAAGVIGTVLLALDQNKRSVSGFRSHPMSSASQTPTGEDKDDPNQIDTIVLGDPADAPVPARRGEHVSPVHPTLLIHLPRFGEQAGLIPDTPAGRLLYAWLAAFNHASSSELAAALPSHAPAATLAALLQLRQQTGGFALLSAREVQPGVLVFRLRDQTPASTEVLGTLQTLPNTSPATIATFSLRAVP